MDEPYLQNFLQNLRGVLRAEAGTRFWPPGGVDDRAGVPRHARTATLPRPQKHSAHRSLHGTVANPIQRLLESLEHADQCPLSGVKRTSRGHALTSAFSFNHLFPELTLGPLRVC